MSILIENMKMPEKCGNCFLRDGIFCIASNYERISYNGLEKKESWCPLVEVSSVKSEPKWIPCSERLPEVGTYVLVSKKPLGFRSNLPNVCTAHRSRNPRSGKEEWNDMLFGELDDDDVFAWMPLPEPWKEGGQE